MISRDTAKPIGLAALLGLAACQMPNPAFEGDGNADEVGDDATDTSASDSSSDEADESGSNSSSEDADADATDTLDSFDTSDDTIEPDLPVVEECNAPFNDPFRPIYGTPLEFGGGQCPLSAIEFAKVKGNGPAIGLLLVEPCAQGCSACSGQSRTLGVVGLDEFTVPLVALSMLETVCLEIHTGQFRGFDEERCLYDSLWVGDGDGSRLLALHRPSQLPFGGMQMLGGKPLPAQGQQLVHCSCSTQYDPGDPDFQCCESSNEPFVSSLFFLEQDLWPGESGIVGLDGGEFSFMVAQSHLLPNCENAGNLGTDQSWALVR